MNILIPLLESLIPALIAQAEALLGVKPDDQHQWIVGLVNEIVSLFDSKLPAWVRPSEQELLVLIEDAIAKVIQKK